MLRSLVLAASIPCAPHALTQGVTRADFAYACQRFERTLALHPPADDRREHVHRSFDALTLQFFAGRGTDALETLARLVRELDPERPHGREVLDALSFEVNPRSLVRSGTVRVSVRVVRPLSDGGGSLRVEPGLLMTPWSMSRMSLDRTGTAASVFEVDVSDDRMPGGGDFEIWCLGGPGKRLVTKIRVGDRSFDDERAINAERLARIEPDSPLLEQALAACRARNALLSDDPSTQSTEQTVVDLPDLSREVAREISALECGDDPYRRRTGDLWRAVESGGKAFALRVHAPEAARGETPLPLVVAIHGADGDESTFFERHGAGRIRALADERDFIVACPRIGFGGLSAHDFDALLLALSYDYAIDATRIFVIGHALGASAAFQLAEERAFDLAGVTCFAGGPTTETGHTLARTLVIAGEIDALVPVERLREGVEAWRELGAPIELFVAENAGHTLVVGEGLARAVDWMFASSR